MRTIGEPHPRNNVHVFIVKTLRIGTELDYRAGTFVVVVNTVPAEQGRRLLQRPDRAGFSTKRPLRRQAPERAAAE
jgi:hypothetical protein